MSHLFLPTITTPLIDPQTNQISHIWLEWFRLLYVDLSDTVIVHFKYGPEGTHPET